MKNMLKFLALITILSLLPACSIPSWLTYTNATYQFLFKYPTGSTLGTDTPTSARIQLPIVPGTNLVEKFLDVSVSPGAMPCLSPYGSGYTPPGSLVTGTSTISGVYWVIESASEGAMGSIYDWTAYSTSNGDTCVSLTFVLHSHHADAYPTPLPEFDSAAETLVFQLIVSTFKWLIPITPTPVVSDTPTPVVSDTPTSVVSDTPTPVVSDTPTPVVSVTPTPVVSDTPTPAKSAFFFTPKFNAYCRSGPDPIFGSIFLAMAGVAYPIDGRNLDNTWLYIMVTPQIGCWVAIDSGTPSGDTLSVRVLNEIPTPTFTPIPFSCSNFTSPQTCAQYSICTWDRISIPNMCKSK